MPAQLPNASQDRRIVAGLPFVEALARRMAASMPNSIDIGDLVQDGTTSDLIFDIPTLVAHVSSVMTLLPGDVILTGTPEGVSNVNPGDEVVCEIDGIGRLVSHLVPDTDFGRQEPPK